MDAWVARDTLALSVAETETPPKAAVTDFTAVVTKAPAAAVAPKAVVDVWTVVVGAAVPVTAGAYLVVVTARTAGETSVDPPAVIDGP